VCNVGYARDIGTKSLLPYLKADDSVITHTDADCTLLKNYISVIEAYFIREG